MNDVGGISRRSSAGFFSSARSFFLPVGPNVSSDRVRGYPIDLRVKTNVRSAELESGRTGGARLFVDDIQWGLGCYERFLSERDELWLTKAMDVCEHLVATQDGAGRWLHPFDARHTWPLSAPWPSGMAQGQAASLLVRGALETGDQRFFDAALHAMTPFAVTVPNGGVRAKLGSGWVAEEYPTNPPSYVLNGAIFALWGMRDVAVGLHDREAAQLYAEAEGSLIDNLWRWDTGWWSRYSLFPHPLPNVASTFYHALHIAQLRAMEAMGGSSVVRDVADRFADYAFSRRNRCSAFALKAAFRCAVPRNQYLAFRLPWFRKKGCSPLAREHDPALGNGELE